MAQIEDSWGRRVLVAACTLSGTTAVAEPLPVEQEMEVEILAPVVVTATRSAEPDFDLPVSIDTLNRETIQQQKPGVLVSEVLPRVPGTVVANRGTFAQEEQIMLRGFGARSQFGTRGVKLIVDGIPASTPDGQGGPGLIDLGSTRNIEVMRGGFSALYGNHSGGVIQTFSEDGPEQPTLSLRVLGGSHSTWIVGSKLGGQSGRLNYMIDGYASGTAGYRDWSRSTKEQLNAKLRIDLESGGTLSLIGNVLNVPDSRDPLGLTGEEVRADPTQASPRALEFKTRRTLDNVQGGAVFEQPLTDADTLRAVAYLGTRSNEQFLGIPIVNQNAITSSGGVSTFERRFFGGSLWWTHERELGAGPLQVTVGTEYDRSADDRKGYLNEFGTRGALKRNEDNTVASWGAFVQGQWVFAPRWSLDLGLRYTEVHFDSDDHFICTPGRVTAPGIGPDSCSGSTSEISATSFNPDDSGSKTYSAWTPALGLLYNLTPSINLYGSVGQTFETPTFIELAYRPDGSAGLNLDLEPARSRHYEVGAKVLIGEETSLGIALFQIDTEEELTVASSLGGRSTYQNAPASRRRGAELSLDTGLGDSLTAYLAATYLDSEFTEDYLACTGVPCRTFAPTLNAAVVDAGNRIPGVPRFSVFGELAYRFAPLGFEGAVNVYGQDEVYVNDRNTETAGQYWLVNLRGGFTQTFGGLELQQFVRIDNVLDREYISAVNVNDANGRYYAPGPGTTYLIGITGSYSF